MTCKAVYLKLCQYGAIVLSIALIIECTADEKQKNVLDGFCTKSYRELPEASAEAINQCINLGGNILVSKRVNFTEESDVTFQFKIKIDIRTNNCLNLVAYEVEEHSIIRLQACADTQNKIASLKLISKTKASEEKEFHVNASVLLAAWYNFALIWRNNQSVEIVVRNLTGGVLHVHTIPVEDLNGDFSLPPGGYLTFGQWEGKLQNVTWKGRIWIDDIAIRQRVQEMDESDDIITMLTFDEGESRLISDEVSTNDLHIIGDMTQIPLWATCPTSPFDDTASPWSHQENISYLNVAEEWCKDLIYHDAMAIECGLQLSPRVVQKFYMDCVKGAAESGNVSKAIHYLQSYANYCELSLRQTLWPAFPVCHTIPDELTPSKCFQIPKNNCYSGTFKEGACQCDGGWFGSSCSNICPGGLERPCGGVGKCIQERGSCLCPMNYNQTNDCTTCASGFFGKNCNIYKMEKVRDLELATALSFGYGRYITFDGLSYSLHNSGEFVFFRNKDISVYVKQVPRSDSSANLRFIIGQIWIHLGSSSVTILPPVASYGGEETQDKNALVLVNGTITNLNIGEHEGLSLGGSRVLWKMSDNWFELKLTNQNQKRGSECHYIRVNVNEDLLNTFLTCWQRRGSRYLGDVKVKPSLAEFPRGLNVEPSKPDDLNNITDTDISYEFAEACEIPSNIKSGFVYATGERYVAQRKATLAGNCLRFVSFNASSISNVARPLSVFSDKLGSAVDLNVDLCYELHLKREKDGVFFTYVSGSANVHGFSLSFQSDTIILEVQNGNWTAIGIEVPKYTFSSWGQLTINCHRKSGNMWLYYTSADGLTYESNPLNVDRINALAPPGGWVGCSVWFSPRGNTQLGGVSHSIMKSFGGTIDEVRIWNRVLSKFEVRQNFGAKILQEKALRKIRDWEPELTSAWNLDEGRGRRVGNLVPGGGHMYIEEDLTQSDVTNQSLSERRDGVFWAVSDAPITRFLHSPTNAKSCSSQTSLQHNFPVFLEKETQWAERGCRESLRAVTENEICLKALGRKHDVFLMQCVEDLLGANSSYSKKKVEISRDAYAGLCRFSLNVTDPCLTNPCRHGGVCDVVDGVHYRCNCSCGYKGKDCEINIDECESSPCSNQGNCRDHVCGFSCDCPNGYVGKLCQRKCTGDLGLESATISDTQMTASSEYQTGMPWYISYLAKRARLNTIGWGAGWVPSDDDDAPWLQISFLEPMRVTGISLQGVRWNGYDAWVTSFALNVSEDSLTWRQHGEEIVGNDASRRRIRRSFNPAITTSHVRLIPHASHVKPAIRMELHGCTACDCCRELGMESFYIRESQIHASSVHGERCKRCSVHTAAWPHFGRLDGPKNKYADFNLWMAEKDDACPWIMVDLLLPHNVNGIIVQGGHFYRYPIFVTSFTVRHSMDNKIWTELEKDFDGNEDAESHRKIVFNAPFQARYVKIVLKDWRTHPGLRFEVLGCSTEELV